MDELKPCPFCGGQANITKQIEGRYALVRYSVTCNGCGVVAFYECTDKDAIAAWNTRHNPNGDLHAKTDVRSNDDCSNDANMDTREKLEADMQELIYLLYESGMKYGVSEHTKICKGEYVQKRTRQLLDRQAEITRRECADFWQHIAEDRDIAEITRDELKEQIENLKTLNGQLCAEVNAKTDIINKMREILNDA